MFDFSSTFCVSKSVRVLFTAFALFICLSAAQSISAATFAVDTTTDDATLTACTTAANDCSLRGAITAANTLGGADIITLPAGIYTLTITGMLEDANATGDLDITANSDVTINGANARTTIIQAGTIGGAGGNGIDRVFHIFAATSSLTLSNVTVRNGLTAATFDNGGGIFSDGNLVVDRSTIVNNRSRRTGGGISIASGTAIVTNSTVAGNTAVDSRGGGIFANVNSTLNIANSTISGNTVIGSGTFFGGGGINNEGATTVTNSTIFGNTSGNSMTEGGGGIRNDNGTLQIRNTIVSDNNSPAPTKDVEGMVVSGGTNLIKVQSTSTGWAVSDLLNNTNANLGALQNNGGNTDTRVLLANSSALNAGQNCVVTATCPVFDAPFPLTTDQRGNTFPRLVNTNVDIGAIETSGPTAASVSISGRVITPQELGLTNARVTLTDSQGNSQTITTGKFGGFRFTNVAAGESYIVSVSARRYTFAPQVITPTEDIADLIFSAQ